MNPKSIKDCCGGSAVAQKSHEDDESLDQEIFLPKGRPGMDHEMLNGYHRHGIQKVQIKARDFLSSNGTMNRIKIRYKPKEVIAYFIQSEHLGDGNSKRKRKSGWLVPGLGRGVFYIPEEQFSKFFEFIEDEGRIIA